MSSKIPDTPLCSKCGQGFDNNKHKRTRHGVCLRCVRDWINEKTPMIGCFKTPRTADQKQAYDPESKP